MVMLAKQLQQVIHNEGTVLHSKALEVLRLCSLPGRLYHHPQSRSERNWYKHGCQLRTDVGVPLNKALGDA
jgi:hypothetical protein